jgi:hypothetical protein
MMLVTGNSQQGTDHMQKDDIDEGIRLGHLETMIQFTDFSA